jgi:hypothetical protein
MAKYRKSFDLNIEDIDLIEQALRGHMASSSMNGGAAADKAGAPRIREIQSLLGKLHQQKIFYSQVKMTQCPGG